MSILNRVKKRKKGSLPKEKIAESEKPKKKQRKSAAPGVLVEPILTEKSTFLSEGDQYTFKVSKRTNKKEIAKAIEEKYKVDVVKVGIISVPRKKIKSGRTPGWKKGFKKAVVRVKSGQKIELTST